MAKGSQEDAGVSRGFVAFVIAAAVGGVACLVGWQWVGGIAGVLLLAVAVLTLTYVAVIAGFWCVVAVLARMMGEPLASDRWALALLALLFVGSIPLSGMAYGFDRDQWIWTSVPLLLAAVAAAVLLHRRSQLRR